MTAARSRTLVAGDSRERLFRLAALVAVAGFVLGLAFRHIVDDPVERSLSNYLRSGTHGMGLALTGSAAHIYFNARSSFWLRRVPLLLEVALRALVMAAGLSTVAVILQVILYDQPLEAQWLADELPSVVVVSVAFFGLFGGRVLLDVVLGRYRHPTRESGC
jgi:hypothetical protein